MTRISLLAKPGFLVTLSAAVLLVGSLQSPAHALEANDMFPAEADPFMGNYVGRWSEEEDVDPDVAAQVIPRARGRYEIRLVSKLDMRCPPLAIIEAQSKDGAIDFSGEGFKGTISNGTITGGRRVGRDTFSMEKVALASPALGAKPPENAIVLFDGDDFEQWESPVGWELLDGGVMMVTPDGDDIKTRQHFKDLKLHLEFRLPYMPRAQKQQRGNSGVDFQGAYELQILDSFGLEGYYNDCGALYKVAAPKVNACRPPLQWQSYDITYRAPRFDGDGQVAEHPRMTVYHNGVLIHNDQEMPWVTGWKEKDRKAPPPTEAGPVTLQSHSNYMQYRNIWLVPLD